MSLTDNILEKASHRMYTCKYYANFGSMNAQTRQWWSAASKANVDARLSELGALEGQKLPNGPYPFLHNNGEWTLLFFPFSEVGPVYTVSPDGKTLACKIVEFATGKAVAKCGVHLFKEKIEGNGLVIIGT